MITFEIFELARAEMGRVDRQRLYGSHESHHVGQLICCLSRTVTPVMDIRSLKTSLRKRRGLDCHCLGVNTGVPWCHCAIGLIPS